MLTRNLTFLFAIVVTFAPFGAEASATDALVIDANIRAIHMPFGTILDPIYAAPASNQLVGYTRCGDSALWTGAYLAAEAFRYNVEPSADALNNVNAALAGLKALTDVTGDNRLARCMVLANSPYAAGIESEEAANTVNQNPPWVWLDNTSRDEVVGAFFGLAVAYDMVSDPTVKSGAAALVSRLVGYISGHNWTPNNDIGNTFLDRPEELYMLIQVNNHMNPSNTVSAPLLSDIVPFQTGVLVDVQSNSSYFKFNLDYMSFYNLNRLQQNSTNQNGYEVVRKYTASHQNAFFDVVDRALEGADPARDAETRALLDQWLQRPKRDAPVDLSQTVAVCGGEACQPVPVPLRPPGDFLWQDDPFALTGGGSGIIESPGVDYLLPYWMGRYYGVISGNTVAPAAATASAVAPDSLAAFYGTGLATGTAQASTSAWPTTLAGATVSVTDAAGTSRSAQIFYASPTQVDFVVPDGTAAGSATFTVTNGSATQSTTEMVEPIAPTLFSMNGAGTGVAAATAISVQAANPALQSPVTVFQCGGSGCTSVPINLGVDTPVYVTFYASGIRNRAALTDVTVTINGTSVPVLYAGPSGYTGLDQVNVLLPLNLRGSGESNVVLMDGATSNTVTINIQ